LQEIFLGYGIAYVFLGFGMLLLVLCIFAISYILLLRHQIRIVNEKIAHPIDKDPTEKEE